MYSAPHVSILTGAVKPNVTILNSEGKGFLGPVLTEGVSARIFPPPDIVVNIKVLCLLRCRPRANFSQFADAR